MVPDAPSRAMGRDRVIKQSPGVEAEELRMANLFKVCIDLMMLADMVALRLDRAPDYRGN